MIIEEQRRKVVADGIALSNYNDKPCKFSRAAFAKVLKISEKIGKGMSKTSLIKWIEKEYNLGHTQAYKYYNAAITYLMPDDVDEYKKQLIQTNIERLETIIEETMKAKGASYINAIQAIKELNKMLGLGDSGKMVAVETPDTKFVIKLGDD